MRFLVDACVDLRLAEWLRGQGHDAIHLLELGLERLSDRAIFEKAASEKRVVVTFDLGFGEIAALTPRQPTSLVVLRLHDARFEFVVERLQTVLAESMPNLESGAIVSVEESRHRVRDLPWEREEGGN